MATKGPPSPLLMPEMLEVIFQFLRAPSSASREQSIWVPLNGTELCSIKSASLVCRTWAEVARLQMIRALSFRSEKHVESFLEYTQKHVDRVSAKARSVILHGAQKSLNSSFTTVLSGDLQIHDSLLQSILPKIPNVTSVVLQFPTETDTAGVTNALMGRTGVQLNFLGQNLPKLKTLTLRFMFWENEEEVAEMIRQMTALEELTFSSSRLPGGSHMVAILDYTPNLRSITVVDQSWGDAELIQYIVKCKNPQRITRLNIWPSSYMPTPTAQSLLRLSFACPFLRTLTLPISYLPSDALRTLSCSPTLPKTLEELNLVACEGILTSTCSIVAIKELLEKCANLTRFRLDHPMADFELVVSCLTRRHILGSCVVDGISIRSYITFREFLDQNAQSLSDITPNWSRSMRFGQKVVIRW
ncbi:hypothetical protein M427DRAFT_358603 [Gonapodya prolifera JEL478]|uniref:F-box domain-containing protein n=1 Tax=Gonapodya prolifera (strain JEL478) TaxID=1344416 RepID=A0A139ABK4_GONPJ|nr:hypothetical protein M427DRAFT_358603 [Gonapodya prolifera JEL478]|eukprot:KXS13855.1 hypothetical protein M427DRAFT_358603 [Gonapodya prolifera JEL478]